MVKSDSRVKGENEIGKTQGLNQLSGGEKILFNTDFNGGREAERKRRGGNLGEVSIG